MVSLPVPVPKEACPGQCGICECCLHYILCLAGSRHRAQHEIPLGRRVAGGLWGQMATWERQCWDDSAHNPSTLCPLLPSSNAELSWDTIGCSLWQGHGLAGWQEASG